MPQAAGHSCACRSTGRWCAGRARARSGGGRGHQRANAQVLVDSGAAVLLDDERDAKANAQKLTPIIQSLLYDATKRQGMSAAARKLGRPDAADAVADLLIKLDAMAEFVITRPM